MTVTQWFSVRNKPVHEGMYECRYVRPEWPGNPPPTYTLPCFRYWNGKSWMMYDYGTATAFGSKEKDQWRGLAKKP